MGREGIQYILIIMGRGVITFQNFQKILIFKKVQNWIFFIEFQRKKIKIENFSKFVCHESDIFLKIGFAEIPYINKGLLVYLVFSMGMGVNIPWVEGSIYPWYIDPPTHGISTPLPMVYRPPYPIQLLTFNAVYSWLYGPGQWMIDRGQRPRLINHWPDPHSHE